MSDKLWGKVGDVARQQERTKSEVVVDALDKYVSEELGDEDDES